MPLENFDKRINVKHVDLSALDKKAGDLKADDPDNDFKLKFQGRLNEVDASTLGYSLVNVTTILREINQEIGTSRIDIKVKSTAPGSFIVHLALEALNDPIFQANLVQAGSVGLTILKTFTDLLKLRKLLKGERPKATTQKDDEIHITTGDNSTVSIDKRTYTLYFKHPVVNEALAKAFKTLESDPSIEGFEVIDAKEQPLFEAGRDDFPSMASTASVPQVEERDTPEDAQVYIVKPSFDPKLKWEVLYKGIRISVWMRDKEFQERIERGERFGKGDRLIVFLKIHQKLDPSLQAYVNKSYEILMVREHIPRLEQKRLWDDRGNLLPPTGTNNVP